MPSRINLTQMGSLPDPQTTFDWALWLPSIPGTSYSSLDFSMRCKTTNVPKESQEDFLVEAQGLQFQYPGRVIWDKKQQVTLFETRDGIVRSMLVQWRDYARNVFNNTGNYRNTYSVTAELDLYDAPGNITKRIALWYFYPLEIGEGTLDQASGVVEYNCSFSYDRCQELSVGSGG